MKDSKPLNSFRQVVVRDSLTYLEKVKIAFSPTQASVISWHDYKLGLGQADMQASRLREHLVLLQKEPILNFRNLRREDLPASPGIYAIYQIDAPDPPLYVGKSENLARRIWDNHIKSKRLTNDNGLCTASFSSLSLASISLLNSSSGTGRWLGHINGIS